MKRRILTEIRTDDTGVFCSITCPFVVGEYCDAFRKAVGRVPGTNGFRYRLGECKSAEVGDEKKV